MDADNVIVLYDIASREPRTTFAANPWKTRFALNFKGLPYRTEWIEMPDIHKVREKLGVPANRTLPNGKPYHTLPVIHDISAGTLLGDSFEIALYLDKAYPDKPTLFQPLSVGLTAAFNQQVDGIFTKYAVLCNQMPFDPKILPVVQDMFAKRLGGVIPVDKRQPDASAREALLTSFEANLGELAKAYRHTGGTTDYFWHSNGTDPAQAQRPPAGLASVGPFLDGMQPDYADFILTAWLKMFQISLPPQEWERMKTWQGGLWATVVDAMNRWSDIK